MIKKETFVTVIDGIKKLCDLEDSFNKFLTDCGFEGYVFFPMDIVDSTVHLLEEIFDDTPGEDEETGGWIGYFLWELNFGSNYEEGCVIDEFDNPVDISTPEKLYDYLIEIMEWGGNDQERE